MNISYNWLRDYLPFDLTPDEVAAALTSIGLETGSVETVQSVRGGLAGLVTGRVLTCTAHPNSDHLHLTTVDVGGDEPLKIVCGAPNVAAGQMVVVAVIGAKLYDGDKEFVIKKSKIRGEESLRVTTASSSCPLTRPWACPRRNTIRSRRTTCWRSTSRRTASMQRRTTG